MEKGAISGLCMWVNQEGWEAFHTAVDIGWWPEEVRLETHGCMGCGNRGCQGSEVIMNLCWPPAGGQCDWQTVGREQWMVRGIISSWRHRFLCIPQKIQLLPRDGSHWILWSREATGVGLSSMDGSCCYVEKWLRGGWKGRMWEPWFEFIVYYKVLRGKALLMEQMWDLRWRDGWGVSWRRGFWTSARVTFWDWEFCVAGAELSIVGCWSASLFSV